MSINSVFKFFPSLFFLLRWAIWLRTRKRSWKEQMRFVLYSHLHPPSFWSFEAIYLTFNNSKYHFPTIFRFDISNTRFVTFFCFSFVFKHNIVEEKTKFGLLYREREVILHLKIMNLHIHNDRQTKEEPKARCFSHPNAIVFKLDWNYSSELLSTHWNRKCMSFVMLKYFRNYEINLFG